MVGRANKKCEEHKRDRRYGEIRLISGGLPFLPDYPPGSWEGQM